MIPNAPNILKYLWFAFGFAMMYVALQAYTFAPSASLTMVSVIVYSLALSIKTAKENYGRDSIIYKVMLSWGERWAKWYDGGNSVYDPSYPFTMDMWHLLRDIMVYAFTAAVVFVSGTTFWIVIPFVENFVFSTKSTLFRDGTYPIAKLIKEFFSTENKFKLP